MAHRVQQQAPARLYAILARRAPYAVVFRRGPSKLVRLIGWHTDTDSFDFGQWFKGRIYERRCDLSPSGRHLIYFAADYKQPYYSWTAISKPPYLTALALWPKGDCWHGGGLFQTSWSIWLNHRPAQARLADGFTLKHRTSIVSNPAAHGEDEPIYGRRLARDGWRLLRVGRCVRRGRKSETDGFSFKFEPPETWQRPNPLHDRRTLNLQMHVHGRFRARGMRTENYVLTFDVCGSESDIVQLGECDWADWDRNGDLLYARSGKLYRLRPARRSRGFTLDPTLAKQIFDLNSQKFEAIAPSPAATVW